MIVRLTLALAFLTSQVRADESLLARPFIIGASLSDGFYVREMGLPFFSPKSKQLGMHHALAKAGAGSGEAIPNLGTNWMFVATDANGRYQVKEAREAKPSVVFAIDYLFWYLYGNSRGRSREDRDLTRLEYFEKGLKNLATLNSPVVVGNIPDGQQSVGLIISASQYPGRDVIDAANERLDEWLKAHPNIVNVDLARFHSLASHDQELTINEKRVPAGKTKEGFLQWDLLHPTPEGVEAIVAVALEALGQSRR